MTKHQDSKQISNIASFPSLVAVFVFLAYLIINSSLTVHRWLLGEGWWFAIVPSLETIILVFGLYGISRLQGTSKKLGLIGLAIVYGSLLIFVLAEYIVQLIYARPFVPQADIPMIRGVLLLLFGQIGSLADVLTPLVQGGILILVWSLCYGLFLVGEKIFSLVPGSWKGTGILSAGALLVFILIQPATILTQRVVQSFLLGRPVEFEDVLTGNRVRGSLSQVLSSDQQLESDADLAHGLDPTKENVDSQPNFVFPGILDRDIYVFVIEAYGYAAHSRDDLFSQLEPDFLRFQDVLSRAGYGMVSNYLLAPVAGGFSWLAEATFLTGQWINSQPVFLQLYDQPVSTLPGFLYHGGYYTFTVKPGTVHGSWPEGWDLFRFREAMVAYDGDFNFRGPWFSYVPITDQFAIHAAHQRIQELRSPGGAAEFRPLLAYYQLVSSHTPFNRIPPYIENWDDLGDGSIYHQLADQILTFDNTWTGGSQLDEGFVASISYVFTVISEYIDRFLDHERNPIIIVFGDHQPQRPIREQYAHLSVPIHIASRDPEILQQFTRFGFTPGFRGNQPPPHIPMSDFFPLFVDVALNPMDMVTNQLEFIE
jgi:hypothetical protein